MLGSHKFKELTVVQDWPAVNWCLEGSGCCWALSSRSDHLHLKPVERCQLKTRNYQDITLLFVRKEKVIYLFIFC